MAHRSQTSWLHCGLAGAAAGALILGLGGRLATALVALAAGRPSNLSLRGLLEVALVGALFGIAGGLLACALQRALPEAGRVRGLLVGGGLCAVTLLWSWLAGRLVLAGGGVVWWTLGAVGATFLLYGLLLERWLARLQEADSGQPG